MPCRFSPRARLLALLLVPALAVGPAPFSPLKAQNLPNLGEESATALSGQMERRIGESYFRELRRDPAFVDDPELSAYIQELGMRLVAVSVDPGAEIEFFLMRDSGINAFAMLGGFIGVNTGLLIAAETESEAASVVAHEIAHLTQKHIARGFAAGQRTSMAALAALAVALLAARSNSQVAAGALAGAQAFQVQSQLAYSRDFEREADRVGFDLLQKAGFDVSAMPAFFERLQRATRIYDSNAPVYVRSHPLTAERIADVRNRAQGVRYRQREDSLAFHLVRAKLRATADAGVDGVRDAQKHFATQLANRTWANEAATHYGSAEAFFLGKDFKAAEASLAAARRLAAHPMLDAMAARLRVAAGDRDGAVAEYRNALSRSPGARFLRFALADALQAAGRHPEALAMLAELARSGRDGPRVYEMQARSYAATGKLMSQHQALGEYYAQLGSPQAAIEQMQIARCAKDGDFYQQSIIDARIRDLWEAILTERAQRGEAGPGGDARRGAPAPAQMPLGRCP